MDNQFAFIPLIAMFFAQGTIKESVTQTDYSRNSSLIHLFFQSTKSAENFYFLLHFITKW